MLLLWNHKSWKKSLRYFSKEQNGEMKLSAVSLWFTAGPRTPAVDVTLIRFRSHRDSLMLRSPSPPVPPALLSVLMVHSGAALSAEFWQGVKWFTSNCKCLIWRSLRLLPPVNQGLLFILLLSLSSVYTTCVGGDEGGGGRVCVCVCLLASEDWVNPGVKRREGAAGDLLSPWFLSQLISMNINTHTRTETDRQSEWVSESHGPTPGIVPWTVHQFLTVFLSAAKTVEETREFEESLIVNDS